MSAPAPRIVAPPPAPFITRAAAIELRPSTSLAPPAPASREAALVFLRQFLALRIDAHEFDSAPLEALTRAADAAGRPNGIGAIAAIHSWERLIQTSIKIVALSKEFAKLPKPLRQGDFIAARPLRSSAKSKAGPLLAVECEIPAVGLHGVKAQSFVDALADAGRIVWIGD